MWLQPGESHHVEVLVHRPCSPPQLRQLARLGSSQAARASTLSNPCFSHYQRCPRWLTRRPGRLTTMRTILSECQAALEAENGFLLQKWKSGRADAQSEELWRGRDRQGTTAQAHQRPATVARRSREIQRLLPRTFAAFPHVPVVEKNRHTTRQPANALQCLLLASCFFRV